MPGPWPTMELIATEISGNHKGSYDIGIQGDAEQEACQCEMSVKPLIGMKFGFFEKPDKGVKRDGQGAEHSVSPVWCWDCWQYCSALCS